MLRNDEVDLVALLERVAELERKMEVLVEEHGTRFRNEDDFLRNIRLTDPTSPMLPENM